MSTILLLKKRPKRHNEKKKGLQFFAPAKNAVFFAPEKCSQNKHSFSTIYTRKHDTLYFMKGVDCPKRKRRVSQ